MTPTTFPPSLVWDSLSVLSAVCGGRGRSINSLRKACSLSWKRTERCLSLLVSGGRVKRGRWGYYPTPPTTADGVHQTPLEDLLSLLPHSTAMGVLRAVSTYPGLTISEIKGLLGPGVSQGVNDLLSLGMVERVRDGRCWRVFVGERWAEASRFWRPGDMAEEWAGWIRESGLEVEMRSHPSGRAYLLVYPLPPKGRHRSGDVQRVYLPDI